MNGTDIATKDDIKKLELKIEALAEKMGSSSQSYEWPWVRTEQAMEFLGLSRNQLLNLRDLGELPFTKIGAIIYYNMSDIDRQMKKNSTLSIYSMAG